MSSSILKTVEAVKVYLLPGDFYFGEGNTLIRTVLGSCVSITVWHPRLRIGGMSHSMLPNRGKQGYHQPDGHYVDEAIELFLQVIDKHHTRPAEYQVKLFGGGHMFRRPFEEMNLNVAVSNVEAARAMLTVNGFNIQAEHVGGSGHRNIIFDLCDGSVLLKHQELMPFPEGSQ